MAAPSAAVTEQVVPVLTGSSGRHSDAVRVFVGGAVASLAAGYTLGVVLGAVPADRRLGVAELAVIVVAAAAIGFLARPQLLEHVQRVRLGTLEFELHAIQRDQDTQRRELADLRLALLVTLTDAERKHLVNLARAGTVEYTGNDAVRVELRRLRALGLISSKRYIGEIRDGQTVDLHAFVELTLRGRDYLAGIDEGERPA